jgi:hypothetical protein
MAADIAPFLQDIQVIIGNRGRADAAAVYDLPDGGRIAPVMVKAADKLNDTLLFL